jgi:hypothetical protein
MLALDDILHRLVYYIWFARQLSQLSSPFIASHESCQHGLNNIMEQDMLRHPFAFSCSPKENEAGTAEGAPSSKPACIKIGENSEREAGKERMHMQTEAHFQGKGHAELSRGGGWVQGWTRKVSRTPFGKRGGVHGQMKGECGGGPGRWAACRGARGRGSGGSGRPG